MKTLSSLPEQKSRLRIVVSGLDDVESRELEEMLSSLIYVDELSTWTDHENADPSSVDTIHASIDEHTVSYVVRFVGEAFAKEVLKDVYVPVKDLILRRFHKWADARNRDSGRERIRFYFDENDELALLTEEEVEHKIQPKERKRIELTFVDDAHWN